MAGGSLDFLFLGPIGAQCGDARASVALGRCWPTVYAVGLNTIVSIFWNLKKKKKSGLIGELLSLHLLNEAALFMQESLPIYLVFKIWSVARTVKWKWKTAKNDYFLKLLQKTMIFIACFAGSLNCWVFSLQIFAYCFLKNLLENYGNFPCDVLQRSIFCLP